MQKIWQKGGKQAFPVRCSGDAFPKMFFARSVRLMARTQDFHSCNMGSTPVQITRFVGAKASITDCRSVDTGSIPVRTAWQKMPDDVIGNSSEFGSDNLSSNLGPVTKMLALAYLVKYHTVNMENRVRAPGSTRKMI